MAKKISELAEITSVATDDYFPLNDTSDNETKRVSQANLLKGVKPVVLYEDETGTTGNVTITGSVAGFLQLEVFYYKTGNVMNGSTFIDVSKGKGQIFDSIDYSGANTFQLYLQPLTIADQLFQTRIVRGTGRYVNLLTDGTNVIATGTENTAYIYKVVGWR